MKKILLIALLTFFVQTTFCQNLADTVNVEYSKNSPKRLTFGFGAPGFGFIWAFSPNLNSILDTKSIDTKNVMGAIPVSLNYQKNRFKIGVEALYGFASDCKSQEKFSTSLKAEIASVSLGYAIVSDRNYFLYFNFGTGYAEYIRTIDIKGSQASSLSSALQLSAGQSIVLKNKGIFLDFSLETMIRNKKVNALGKSIKLGYRYGLKQNDWNSTFNSFTDVPSDRMSSLYMQLTLTLPYLSWISSENSTSNK